MHFPVRTILTAAAHPGRRLERISIALILALLFGSSAGSAAEVSKEYKLKAVFLWRLAQFVDWPASAFEKPDSPIVIGVLGDNPFGEALQAVVQGETARGRKLVLKYFRRMDEIQTCHVLFISKSEARHVEDITQALRDRPILTVSEIEDFAVRRGGIVCLLPHDNKVTLRINADNANAAHLVLDPRLMRMAEVVRNK